MNDQNPLFVPLLIALLGMAAPLIKTWMERRKPEAEALEIYRKIEIDNAKQALSIITDLRADVARLRGICKTHGINPDTGTGPLGKPSG